MKIVDEMGIGRAGRENQEGHEMCLLLDTYALGAKNNPLCHFLVQPGIDLDCTCVFIHDTNTREM